MLFASSRLACQRVVALAVKSCRQYPPQALNNQLYQQPLQQRSLTALQHQQPVAAANYHAVANNMLEAFSSWISLIKRTFQPSLLRRKRKFGYLKRRTTVGGRKILKRRMAKKRARLFGA